MDMRVVEGERLLCDWWNEHDVWGRLIGSCWRGGRRAGSRRERRRECFMMLMMT